MTPRIRSLVLPNLECLAKSGNGGMGIVYEAASPKTAFVAPASCSRSQGRAVSSECEPVVRI